MMKQAYQLGCQAALTKLGFGLTGGLMAKVKPKLTQPLGQNLGTGMGSQGGMPPSSQAGLGQMAGTGGAAALSGAKTSGARVLVTREQTPQEQSEPMNMAQEQQHTVEHLWDEHDKRQQLYTSRDSD